MTLLRSGIKAAAYAAAAAVAPVLMRALPGPRLLVLTYHRVLPADHSARAYEEQGMVVSPERLEQHLRLLGRYASFMHIDDWLAQRDAGAALPRLACAVTFDDGWADNFHYAYPVLQRLHVPASIFLATARIGCEQGFWPTRLSRQLFAAWHAADQRFFDGMAQHLPAVHWHARVDGDRQRLAAHDLIAALKHHYVDAQIDAALDQVAPRMQERQPADLLDWEQVSAMAASGLVRFGSHTRNHRRLVTTLPESEMRDEVMGSIADLQAHLPGWSGGFCYPNGDSSPVARSQVQSHYSYCVFTELGVNGPAVDAHRLQRVSLHDRSGAGRNAVLGRIAGAYLGLGV